ncbi:MULTISPECIES: hypothetical protein [Planktothrix]|uniref:Uncharacterized protein n=1 Tax=Planktothrix mougeotii LEGE 06226 TaxID=1828728 RepID=A0ABR9UFY4_9CYAN|nr:MULTISPECIES: hypothetical protein [Planktothrix]MBD2482238.1 hypothetical protein [Planktothrix sp. FACHB-1365]MBE9145386.1 hypothetical protein [Planktothrix mougeotii LEGE 06226]
MNTDLTYGLLLALINGAICLLLPAIVSYLQRQRQNNDQSSVMTQQQN